MPGMLSKCAAGTLMEVWRAGCGCWQGAHRPPPGTALLSLTQLAGATQTLSYAGQHMADDKLLMQYHVPAVRSKMQASGF